MSHDIRLVGEDGEVCTVERHSEGGTYVMGGTPTAELNVTYNYAWFYYKFLDKEKGISWIYDKKGKEVIERLEAFIKELETPPCFGSATSKGDDNYWAPTPSNAAKSIRILLAWAKEHPEATFKGD